MSTRKFTVRQIRNIRRRVLYWGRRNYQDYPWRTEKDPWLTLVAELFLQRTQARQVRAVYRDFSKRYPTPKALLDADSNEVFQLVGKLGLGSRLRFLREIAAVAIAHGGVLPEDMGELTKLRGVGPYTAAAWLSLYRGKRAVIIDSNVVRWLSRMTGNPYSREPNEVSWAKEIAERLTPPRVFQEYNHAVLDFTMKICAPRKPDCAHCPILVDCRYGYQAQLCCTYKGQAGEEITRGASPPTENF